MSDFGGFWANSRLQILSLLGSCWLSYMFLQVSDDVLRNSCGNFSVVRESISVYWAGVPGTLIPY